jgi:hypothetical protein
MNSSLYSGYKILEKDEKCSLKALGICLSKLENEEETNSGYGKI